MGAKTWMLVIADTDAKQALAQAKDLDESATFDMASALFPGEKLVPLSAGELSYTNPPDDELYIACYPGVSIVAAHEFAIDKPSQLPARFINYAPQATLTLHVMHSVVDWFVYAVWHKGQLQRALSLAPDMGVMENIGTPLPFEAPYWAGQHPAIENGEQDADSYPLPFHPLELGEAALLALYGYQLEGYIDPNALDPNTIKLLRYKRVKQRWWKFWA